MAFRTWKELSAQLKESLSSLKRRAAEDPEFFPTKIELTPGHRVAFRDVDCDAYEELLFVRQLELQGHYVSQRKRELEAILRADAFIDQSAANATVERRHQERASAT
jgi:hypothetical protein